MHIHLGAVILPALIWSADAFPSSASHAVHEKREVTHARWVKRDGLHPLSRLPMRISLTQSNLDRGFEYIMDVYVSH